MEYNLIRSRRRSICIEINEDKITVRAPAGMKTEEIDDFVKKHEVWIEKHKAMAKERTKCREEAKKLTVEELKALAENALRVIPERVRHYAPLVGVSYGKITIRNQRTRWGSCSSKGNLNFNCLLMLAPPEVIDSVIVHELCHRKEMNHSKRFYDEVYRVFPDYDKWHKWLKENGSALLYRMP